MEKTRQEVLERLAVLEREASTWRQHWMELGDYIKPESIRWLTNQKNRGEKRRQRIINSSPCVALRTMAAGMMSGMSSPARAWYRLGPHDPAMNKFGRIRDWFDQVEEISRLYLAGSNVYGGLHQLYEDLGIYGTACAALEVDTEDCVRMYNFPTGQYLLATSDRGVVDTAYRKFSFTVRQLVQKFGLEACGPRVKDHAKNNHRDTWIEVVHAIEPNPDFEQGRIGPKGKRWLSLWLERSDEGRKDQFLRTGGFNRFHVLAPRWETYGEDVYGRSPGMMALGDIKALQLLERRKAQLVEKIYDPAMVWPVSMRNRRSSTTPGSDIYLDNVGNGNLARPAMEIPPAAVEVVEASIQQHVKRIDSVFYADLWLSMLSGEDNDPQKTAREIAEIQEEKLSQLGPVMERLDRDLFSPLITTVIDLLAEQGKLPPPPPELHGQAYTIEYVSIVAQAQKMAGLSTKSQLVAFVTNLKELKPEVVDKLDGDALVEDVAEDLGVKSTLIVPDEQVAQDRAQRQQMAEQQQQQAAALAATQGAKNLAQAPMDGDNALSRVAGSISPVAAGLAGGA